MELKESEALYFLCTLSVLSKGDALHWLVTTVLYPASATFQLLAVHHICLQTMKGAIIHITETINCSLTLVVLAMHTHTSHSCMWQPGQGRYSRTQSYSDINFQTL